LCEWMMEKGANPRKCKNKEHFHGI